tara:strand:+ start:237 stop:401 length:165 start_codon:yes stop_codon:yes gene_type:complete
MKHYIANIHAFSAKSVHFATKVYVFKNKYCVVNALVIHVLARIKNGISKKGGKK